MLSILTRGIRRFCQGKKPYIYPYNVNREQQRKYLKSVDEEVKRVENVTPKLLPRRKRRIYDRPKFNTDLTNYAVWRTFENDVFGNFVDNGYPLAMKLMLSPKWLLHCFGEGFIPPMSQQQSSKEYYFEDSNLSHFLLRDFRQTTLYKPNVEGYNYADQSMVEPRRRLVERVDPDVFWTLDKEFEFRVYSTKHAENQRFKAWLLKTLEESKSKPSYDQFIDEKFGKVYCFNQMEDAKHYKTKQPLIKYFDKSHFSQLGKIPDVKAKKQQQQTGKKDKKKKKQETPETQEVKQPELDLKQPEPEVKAPSFQFAKMMAESSKISNGGSIFQIFAEQEEQKKIESQQMAKQAEQPKKEQNKENQKKQKQNNKAS